MTSHEPTVHRRCFTILLFTACMTAWSVPAALAQALTFADGLVYNDFYAVTVHTVEGGSFTLFDAAAYDGGTLPWPDAEGTFGGAPGSSPREDQSYFLWIRRVGGTGAVTYPLAFSKIKDIVFNGPYGGTVSALPVEGTLTVDGEETVVTVRRDGQRVSGWTGIREPGVPYYSSAVLTLTDGSVQNVYVKTDGFLGGIDEEFGTYAMLWLRHDGVTRLEFLHDGRYARCPECGAIFFDNRAENCPFDGTELVPQR